MNVAVKNWKADLTTGASITDIKLLSNIKVLFLCFVCFYTPAVVSGMSGDQLYTQSCIVCHADDGSGAMPGVSDLTENKAWLALDDEILLIKLKQGIQNQGSTMSMPAKGGNPDLTDDDLRAIIRYMRQTFIN